MSTRHSRIWLAAVGVVVVATTLAIISSISDSLVVDEVPHIGAGFSYIRTFDMRLNPEHPPLAKDLAGIALLALPLDRSGFTMPQWTTQTNGQWEFGKHAIFYSGVNPDVVKNVARLPELLFFFVCCWVVWRWTRERYDTTAALIAVVLLAFSPTVLAHMRLVTTDMAAATGVTVATYCFLRYLRAPRAGTFVLAAFVLGMAFLAKFNTVLLGPYFLIVAALYGIGGHWHSALHRKNALRAVGFTIGIGAVAFFAVVWPVYIAHTWNYPPARQLSDTKSITGWYADNPLKQFALWGADKPIIRGAAFWTLGLDMAAQRSVGGNNIYWLGRVVNNGGPLYFPLVYFLKEPLAWWGLVILAVLACIVLRHHRRSQEHHGTWIERYTDEWVWLLWLAIYWAVSINSTLNIGIRHLLPVYPFAIMLVSGQISALLARLQLLGARRWKFVSLAVAALVGWYVFESVNVFPHYITYFNQVAGGPSGGYRYVADSNLDWGQDLKRFSQWVKDNNIQRISLDYFGWADPTWYLGKRFVWTTSTQFTSARDFLQRNGSNGWIAISATFLQNTNGEKTKSSGASGGSYRWLLDYKPAAVIGHSIFVWHIQR